MMKKTLAVALVGVASAVRMYEQDQGVYAFNPGALPELAMISADLEKKKKKDHLGISDEDATESKNTTSVHSGEDSSNTTSVKSGEKSSNGTSVHSGRNSDNTSDVLSGSNSNNGTSVRSGTKSDNTTIVKSGHDSKNGT